MRVSDDEEPWFKGAAEMFALVSGFGLDGKVRVDSVAMPYLQYDGTTYYPNQILVNWSNYKYNLADVVLMEDDGDTNYLALAQAIAAVLLTIADQGAYIPLVNAVLGAMPASWWVDDPDYVESWYTLARGSSGRLNGARQRLDDRRAVLRAAVSDPAPAPARRRPDRAVAGSGGQPDTDGEPSAGGARWR
ncbi:hypothetical protein GCM10020229_55770 [Kitasatospora albolonga]